MRHAQEQENSGNATNTTLPLNNGLHEPNHAEIQWQINNANRANSVNASNPIQLTTNHTGVGFASSIGTATFNIYGQKEVINVEIKETTIVIAYREHPNYTYAINYNNIQPADRVWKEVYGLKDGKMTLLEVIHGKHTPSHNVQETIEFDDEKEKG